MINLLPTSTRQSVRREYVSRLSIVTCIMLSCAIVIGIVALLPSFFLSFIKESELVEQKAIVDKAALLRKESDIETTAGAINKKIELFNSGSEEKLLPSGIIQAATLARGEVRLNGFFYQKTIDKKRADKIIITGVATRREALIAFADELRKNVIIAEVDVPTANLIQSSDITFSITALGKSK
ncbi:MAG TPA: hypothetical protein VJB70_01545 [Candidatus Paceibacterota bacterium]